MALCSFTELPSITRSNLETLQVSMGYCCNQRCIHCHVNAGPNRPEMMGEGTLRSIIHFLDRSGIQRLDLTGGAPEMNPHFRGLVRAARKTGVHVMDRCNLTILEEPAYQGLAEFLADHQVEVIASLPCYLRENVDDQRGKGVFEISMMALRKLNQLGYGRRGSNLILNLVYNPLGPFLPPPQKALEEDYRRQLGERYSIVFNQLYTITNMPIHRFRNLLASRGELEAYRKLLQEAYREANLHSVMCRTLISVDWRGYVYDCDFNQALVIPLGGEGQNRIHLSDLMDGNLEGRPVLFREHCYGCTAGQGSSCCGALR